MTAITAESYFLDDCLDFGSLYVAIEPFSEPTAPAREELDKCIDLTSSLHPTRGVSGFMYGDGALELYGPTQIVELFPVDSARTLVFLPSDQAGESMTVFPHCHVRKLAPQEKTTRVLFAVSDCIRAVPVP